MKKRCVLWRRTTLPPYGVAACDSISPIRMPRGLPAAVGESLACHASNSARISDFRAGSHRCMTCSRPSAAFPLIRASASSAVNCDQQAVQLRAPVPGQTLRPACSQANSRKASRPADRRCGFVLWPFGVRWTVLPGVWVLTDSDASRRISRWPSCIRNASRLSTAPDVAWFFRWKGHPSLCRNACSGQRASRKMSRWRRITSLGRGRLSVQPHSAKPWIVLARSRWRA
ncbi:hypothetical protein D9M72_199430 [compost metagenome]